MSTKKPVIIESYDEIVFPEPSEAFLARAQNHTAVVMPRLPSGLTLPSPGMFGLSVTLFLCFDFGLVGKKKKNEWNGFILRAVPIEDESERDVKDNPLSQWFKKFSEADELLQLAAARQQVNISPRLFGLLLSLKCS